MMRLPDVVRRIPLSPQVLTFLAVGGAGYVVDVAVFNLLRSTATLGAWDPSKPNDCRGCLPPKG